MTAPGDRAAWLVRAASRAETGAGHVERCLALAQQLPGPIRFVLDPASPWAERVAKCGFAWEMEESADSSAKTCRDLATGAAAGAIFDGYDLNADEIAGAAAHGFVAEIVDAGAPRGSHAVIDPNLGAAGSRHGAAVSLRLAGAEYALLRPAFVAANSRVEHRRRVAGGVGRVLVAMGARDSANATTLSLAALERASIQASVDVVLPPTALHFASVRALIDTWSNVELHTAVSDPIPLYEAADLAIGAGGLSLLERLCCGLPSIVLSLSANQRASALAADRAGAAHDMGEAATLKPDALAAIVADLSTDPAGRRRMAEIGRRLVDGLGAKRAAAALEQHKSALAA